MGNIYVCFRKLLTSLGFYLCILGTVALLFSAQVYTDTVNENRYSVIQAAMEFDGGYCLQHYDLCDFMIMKNAEYGWLTLFVPMITAFCFVPSMCTEQASNAIRYQIFRSSRLKFEFSRFLSGIISGGTAAAVGYAVFCGTVSLLFPAAAEYGGYEGQILADITFSFPCELLGIWLYGVFWSTPAMLLTSMMQNKYLIICIPFFVKYGMTQGYQRMIQSAVGDFENVDHDLLKFLNITSPEALMGLDGNGDFGWILLCFGTLLSGFLILYLTIQKSRRDCGA